MIYYFEKDAIERLEQLSNLQEEKYSIKRGALSSMNRLELKWIEEDICRIHEDMSILEKRLDEIDKNKTSVEIGGVEYCR